MLQVRITTSVSDGWLASEAIPSGYTLRVGASALAVTANQIVTVPQLPAGPLEVALESEPIEQHRFRTQAEARMAVFDYIEGWYNPHRRHSGLGQKSPLNFERGHAHAA